MSKQSVTSAKREGILILIGVRRGLVAIARAIVRGIVHEALVIVCAIAGDILKELRRAARSAARAL